MINFIVEGFERYKPERQYSDGHGNICPQNTKEMAARLFEEGLLGLDVWLTRDLKVKNIVFKYNEHVPTTGRNIFKCTDDLSEPPYDFNVRVTLSRVGPRENQILIESPEIPVDIKTLHLFGVHKLVKRYLNEQVEAL